MGGAGEGREFGVAACLLLADPLGAVHPWLSLQLCSSHMGSVCVGMGALGKQVGKAAAFFVVFFF